MSRLLTLVFLVPCLWGMAGWAGEPRKATDLKLDLPKPRKAKGAKSATDLKLDLPKRSIPGGVRKATDFDGDLPNIPLALDGDKPLNATRVNLGKSGPSVKDPPSAGEKNPNAKAKRPAAPNRP